MLDIFLSAVAWAAISAFLMYFLAWKKNDLLEKEKIKEIESLRKDVDTRQARVDEEKNELLQSRQKIEKMEGE